MRPAASQSVLTAVTYKDVEKTLILGGRWIESCDVSWGESLWPDTDASQHLILLTR